MKEKCMMEVEKQRKKILKFKKKMKRGVDRKDEDETGIKVPHAPLLQNSVIVKHYKKR